MDWSETLYGTVFRDRMPGFALRENDYVVGERKFGGNAQSISGKRWVHHTSFLWNFSPRNMALLANPAKQPEYRGKREHVDFLCQLSEFWPDQQTLTEALVTQLSQQYLVEEVELETAEAEMLPREYRRATKFVDLHDPDLK